MSIFDHPDGVQPAPSWRCPACRTLQPEATQCWRCDTPAFSCRTCYRYRPSVAAGLGYCAADPARTPLSADETRACWEAVEVPELGAAAASPGESGLFPQAELVPAPARPTAPRRHAPPNGAYRPTPPRETRPPKPPLEVPGRAAWAEPESDALIEAPDVAPSMRIGTEVQRRRRRWSR